MQSEPPKQRPASANLKREFRKVQASKKITMHSETIRDIPPTKIFLFATQRDPRRFFCLRVEENHAYDFARHRNWGTCSMKPLLALIASALALLAIASPASAQTTYKYDALGRLVEVRDTSDTSDIATYTYDPADNRTKVKSGNAAPSAVADWYFLMTTGSTWSGVLSVLDNDTDTDLPDDTLSVVSASGSYTSAGTDGIGITSAPVGTHYASYTMRDANGSTSGAEVTYQVVYCNPFCELDP